MNDWLLFGFSLLCSGMALHIGLGGAHAGGLAMAMLGLVAAMSARRRLAHGRR